MADKIIQKNTPVSCENVTTSAIQYFSTEKWRVTSQSARAVTFEGRVPIPWFHILCVIIGFMLCVVPGLILYLLLVRKVRRFQNIVVTASPVGSRTEVSISYPSHAKNLVRRFLAALPD